MIPSVSTKGPAQFDQNISESAASPKSFLANSPSSLSRPIEIPNSRLTLFGFGSNSLNSPSLQAHLSSSTKTATPTGSQHGLDQNQLGRASIELKPKSFAPSYGFTPKLSENSKPLNFTQSADTTPAVQLSGFTPRPSPESQFVSLESIRASAVQNNTSNPTIQILDPVRQPIIHPKFTSTAFAPSQEIDDSISQQILDEDISSNQQEIISPRLSSFISPNATNTSSSRAPLALGLLSMHFSQMRSNGGEEI